MKKWYQRCLWMLVASLALELSGCAKGSAYLSKITGRQSEDQKLVDVDGKTRKKKSDTSSKKSDSLREKASDSQLAKKSSKPKVESRDDSSREVADSKPSTKPSTKPVKKADGNANDPFLSDEMQSLVDARETAKKAKDEANDLIVDTKAKAKQKFADESTRVQEVAHKVEDNLADLPEWAAEGEATVRKEITKASQEISKTRDSAKAIADEAKAEFDDEAAAIRDGVKAKIAKAVKTEVSPASVNLTGLCPNAQGELREAIGSLDEKDVEGLKRGVHRIGRMGPDAAAAAPAMVHLLKHKDGFVRTHAALALARMQASPPEAVQTVVDGLKSTDPGLRSFAAAVLAEMGPQAGDALATLAESLKDQDGYVRLHAAEVLIRYDRWSYQALETLLNGLTDKDENIRWLATYSLAELAPESQETVDALLAATKDPVMKVKVGAVYALGEIGPFAKSASTPLRTLADSSTNQELHSVILNALQQIEQ